MKEQKNIFFVAPRPNAFIRLWNWVVAKVTYLFEPEEVEVTFKEEGNHMSYTYTKVEHKQVA